MSDPQIIPYKSRSLCCAILIMTNKGEEATISFRKEHENIKGRKNTIKMTFTIQL